MSTSELSRQIWYNLARKAGKGGGGTCHGLVLHPGGVAKYIQLLHTTKPKINELLPFSLLSLAAKSSNNEKTKSSKDPNKEPSSLFQREGVHMLLGELSRRFPPQFLQGQTTTGKLVVNSLVCLLITVEPRLTTIPSPVQLSSLLITCAASVPEWVEWNPHCSPPLFVLPDFEKALSWGPVSFGLYGWEHLLPPWGGPTTPKHSCKIPENSVSLGY